MTILQPEDKRLVCNVLRKMGIPHDQHDEHIAQDFDGSGGIPYAQQKRALATYKAIANSLIGERRPISHEARRKRSAYTHSKKHWLRKFVRAIIRPFK